MPKFPTTIQSLPQEPGIYIFKDKSGVILYVGKAINLKNRVSSYFQKGSALMPDKQKMLKKICEIEHQITDSEIEALILELELIKKYRPKYNIAFKDDKHFQYIKIDYSDDFPKIITSRKKKNDNAEYFGPFPSSKTVKQILNLLNRLFHYRECRMKMTSAAVRTKKYRICLRYHLGRCYGPCVGKISKKEYARLIKQCKMFLEGKKTEILRDLENSMKEASKQQNYEEATRLRDQIIGIKQLANRQKYEKKHDSQFFNNRQKVKNLETALLGLKNMLNLQTKPERIECFDISNIQGVSATGSMAVFENGVPAKNEYRRFKIRIKEKPDDVAMMEEILIRRFKHLGWPLPDLIILDGGKPQLGAALKVLKKYNLNISSIALAKKNEEIYLPKTQKPLILPQNSQALFLLQRLRDEAHRFAITYHKKLRKIRLLT